MNIGLNASLSSQKPDDKRYKWAATHCLQIDSATEATTNYVQCTDFPAILNKISGAGSADIGDAITISFWVKPLWDIGTRDGVANSILHGGSTGSAIMFGMGAKDSSSQRILVYYNVRSGSSIRNRLVVTVKGTNGNNIDQQSLHNDNTIVGCGAAAGNFWEKDNLGNVNDEGFTHLAFTRATGTADWIGYWNGADLEFNVDGDTDSDPDPVENDYDGMVLGATAYYQEDDPQTPNTPAKYRDFTIYNSALSASNIAELYNSGNFYDVRTSSTAAVAAPAVYYPFNHNYADYMRAGGDMNGNQKFVAL